MSLIPMLLQLLLRSSNMQQDVVMRVMGRSDYLESVSLITFSAWMKVVLEIHVTRAMQS